MKCKSILIPDRINLLYREYKTSILYTYCSTQYSTLALGRLLFACLAFKSNPARGFCWLELNISLEQIFHVVNVYSMQSFLCIIVCHLLRLNHAPPPPPPHKKSRYFKVLGSILFPYEICSLKSFISPRKNHQTPEQIA